MAVSLLLGGDSPTMDENSLLCMSKDAIKIPGNHPQREHTRGKGVGRVGSSGRRPPPLPQGCPGPRAAAVGVDAAVATGAEDGEELAIVLQFVPPVLRRHLWGNGRRGLRRKLYLK